MATAHFQKLGDQVLRGASACALVLVSLIPSGCTSTNLRGEPFVQDDWTTLPQSVRRADQVGPPSAYSNKARQIERNLGVP